jgi:hypothetical protein
MKIGVTGYHTELIGKVDFFEIDAQDIRSLQPFTRSRTPISISANHFFFSHSDSEVFRDRILSLAESIQKLNVLFLLLKLPPSFFDRQTGFEQIQEWLQIWRHESSVPVFVDLPQKIPARLQSMLPNGLEFSVDPMWFKPKKVKCWKIHGWHDARWIRMYASSDLSNLHSQAKRLKPEFLIFGHSQRVIQVEQFLMLD